MRTLQEAISTAKMHANALDAAIDDALNDCDQMIGAGAMAKDYETVVLAARAALALRAMGDKFRRATARSVRNEFR
jgi:hypothetical protein